MNIEEFNSRNRAIIISKTRNFVSRQIIITAKKKYIPHDDR